MLPRERGFLRVPHEPTVNTIVAHAEAEEWLEQPCLGIPGHNSRRDKTSDEVPSKRSGANEIVGE